MLNDFSTIFQQQEEAKVVFQTLAQSLKSLELPSNMRQNLSETEQQLLAQNLQVLQQAGENVET